MYDTILVPTDGSEVAETAAATAIALARRFDAAVYALHVQRVGALAPDEEDAEGGPFAHEGQRALDEIARQADQAGVEASTALVSGDAAIHRAILHYAETQDVDCVVVGTHGRTGLDRYVMGSVAERVVRGSPIPVLTVHEDTVVPSEFASILVPTDGSESSTRAADHAFAFAAETGADVDAIYVVENAVARDGTGLDVAIDALSGAGESILADLSERATSRGYDPIETTTRRGRPYREIVAYADEHDVDLIVLGTHGRSGIDRLLLGSVASRVVRLSDVPVLTVGGANDDEE